jgi:hypothetical protein
VAETRIYLVSDMKSDPPEHRLVRSATAAQARHHVTSERFAVDVAKQEAIVDLLEKGVKVETAPGRAIAAVLAILVLAFGFAQPVKAADIAVQHDGVTVFHATAAPAMGTFDPQSGVLNFTGTPTTPTACPTTPRTRAAASNIQYLPDSALRRNVDLTAWTGIWGFITAAGTTPTPWPGVPGASPTILTIGKTQYVAAKFHVGAVAATLSGQYVDVSYGAGPAIDAAISAACGDFAPAGAACHTTTAIASQDQIFLPWKAAPGNAAHCGLAPNTDYYLNIRFHDAAPTGPGCTGSTCRLTIQNFHN